MTRALAFDLTTSKPTLAPPCLRSRPELSEPAVRALLQLIDSAALPEDVAAELDELGLRLRRWLEDSGTRVLRAIEASAPEARECCAVPEHRAAVEALLAGGSGT